MTLFNIQLNTHKPLKLTCALVASLAITACNKPPESTEQKAEGTAEQAAKVALKIGSDLTFPPYEYLDGDKPAGLI